MTSKTLNKRKKMTNKKREALTGLMFITPWIIGFLLFIAFPFIRTIYFSFNNVQYSGEVGFIYTFVGFENYERILTIDVDFVLELQNFVVRIFAYVPVIIALSIIIAMLLNSKLKGTSMFRLIFFLPVIILNGQLLDNMKNFGDTDLSIGGIVYSVILKIVPSYLNEVILLLFHTVSEILWYCGIPILIFLAALQKIDKSVYEAAQIDGASAWNIFWKITLPVIYPLISVIIIFIVVFLANFDGNPINDIITISRTNPARREGYASALALIYSFVQTFLIVALYLIFRKKEKGVA